MKIVNKITINESEETAEEARLLLGVIKTKKTGSKTYVIIPFNF